MRYALLLAALLSSAVFARIDSSVKVPAPLHELAVFGNHAAHPVQKMKVRQQLQRLAPLSCEEVKTKLSAQGFRIEQIALRDVASNLLYVGWGYDTNEKAVKVFVDPATGTVVHREERS
ncbi:PepSY domain-containing protein [Sulfuricurvum sp. IAE1]|uniref:PepSY domain-containing protein n=1 Tax=Sulfuricurvum sp. IAE1 TaxID=2546102 RepID=UPI001405249F|nr:PepSY domain-containing protein [Sulfuricurvum sp. IAE1]